MPPFALKGETVRLSVYNSPLGDILLGADSHGLCISVFMNNYSIDKWVNSSGIGKVFSSVIYNRTNSHIESAICELEEYFKGKLRKFQTPIFFYKGTDFQLNVWSLLNSIPYGQTISYSELALKTGNKNAVRAVAGANACNMISVIIPCHRVIYKSGNTGGYSGGIWRKARLLELEWSNSY